MWNDDTGSTDNRIENVAGEVKVSPDDLKRILDRIQFTHWDLDDYVEWAEDDDTDAVFIDDVDDTYVFAVPRKFWDELGEDLGLDVYEIEAAMLVHDRQVKDLMISSTADSSPIDRDGMHAFCFYAPDTLL